MTTTISNGIMLDKEIDTFWYLYNSHNFFPFLLFVAYLFVVVKYYKFKVKNWIFEIVELYAFGHAFELAVYMFSSTFVTEDNNGGLLSGTILGGITLVGIYKILVDNPKNAVKPIPRFKVIAAHFGINGNENGVLHVINNLISAGRLNTLVNVDLFGDHVPGVSKRLRLVYEIDGKTHTRDFPEDAEIRLP